MNESVSHGQGQNVDCGVQYEKARDPQEEQSGPEDSVDASGEGRTRSDSQPNYCQNQMNDVVKRVELEDDEFFSMRRSEVSETGHHETKQSDEEISSAGCSTEPLACRQAFTRSGSIGGHGEYFEANPPPISGQSLANPWLGRERIVNEA